MVRTENLWLGCGVRRGEDRTTIAGTEGYDLQSSNGTHKLFERGTKTGVTAGESSGQNYLTPSNQIDFSFQTLRVVIFTLPPRANISRDLLPESSGKHKNMDCHPSLAKISIDVRSTKLDLVVDKSHCRSY